MGHSDFKQFYQVTYCIRWAGATSYLPHQKKCSICISNFIKTTFFYLGRLLKKLADNKSSSITKGSIYHIKHNTCIRSYVHTTFYHSSGLSRNLIFNGSIYYVLYLQILCFYLGRQSTHTCNLLENSLQVTIRSNQDPKFGKNLKIQDSLEENCKNRSRF